MPNKTISYVIANFGGPRNIAEIAEFLTALLTDKDVVRTKLPQPIHNFLFTRIAKKRSKKIAADYEQIGGKSPIFEDTEKVKELLEKKINAPLLTFHRYLPKTHPEFIKKIQNLQTDEIRIFPMFPQFTYATTGSIARWFDKFLHKKIVNKMRWIKSYASHPLFIQAQQELIKRFLKKNQLKFKDTVLLFSCHGVPQTFVDNSDIYYDECKAGFLKIMEEFEGVLGKLSFQSKFGPGEWIKPYTSDVCESVLTWHEGRQNIVVVPLSFTSDHIETLFEIEDEYLPPIHKQGLNAYRVPALTHDPLWIKAIEKIMQEDNLCNNQMLIRKF